MRQTDDDVPVHPTVSLGGGKLTSVKRLKQAAVVWRLRTWLQLFADGHTTAFPKSLLQTV